MLRRTDAGQLEFRDLERRIHAEQPGTLSAERREALKAKIFEALEAQDPAARGLSAFLSPRWVAIPLGVGVAAAVIAGSRPVYDAVIEERGGHGQPVVVGQLRINGGTARDVHAGDRVESDRFSTILFSGGDVRTDLADGTAVRMAEFDGQLGIELIDGELTVASSGPRFAVLASGFSGSLEAGGVMRISTSPARVEVIEGTATVIAGGKACTVRAGETALVTPGVSCTVVTPNVATSFAPGTGGPEVRGNAPAGPNASPETAPPTTNIKPPAHPAGGPAAEVPPAGPAPTSVEPPAGQPTPDDHGDPASQGDGASGPNGAGPGGDGPPGQTGGDNSESHGPDDEGPPGGPPEAPPGGGPPETPPGGGPPETPPGGGPPETPPAGGPPETPPGGGPHETPPGGGPPETPPGGGPPESPPGGGPPESPPGGGPPETPPGGGPPETPPGQAKK